MKTREEIRASTTGKIPRPANYKYGEKLQEWDASLPAGAGDLLKRLNPINDRIVVKLIDEIPSGQKLRRSVGKRGDGIQAASPRIVLTDTKPLIGGECREAIVLKCGPGKWIEGGWWKLDGTSVDAARIVLGVAGEIEVNERGFWQWFPGERRPVSVKPGQTVYIGNWVDLEANGLALCQEGDVRGYLPSQYPK